MLQGFCALLNQITLFKNFKGLHLILVLMSSYEKNGKKGLYRTSTVNKFLNNINE